MSSDDRIAAIEHRIRHIREDLAHVHAQLLNTLGSPNDLLVPVEPTTRCQCPECTCTLATETELEEHVIANHPD